VTQPDAPTSIRIAFASGGSGGHLAPALAIAQQIAEIQPETQCLFFCSQRAIDARMFTAADAEHIPLPIVPPGKHPRQVLAFLRTYRQSKRLARLHMRQYGITQLVSLGGFVSVPVVAAAKSLRLPITLLNLDAPPGKANRWLARRCDQVWTAVDLPQHPRFASNVTGLPLRREALAPGDAATCRRELGLDPDRPTLLITGASQGASSLNRFMLAFLEQHADALRDWQVIHLTGSDAPPQIESTYKQHGIPALVIPFLDRIGCAWGAADLALSRAGANSVAEVAANTVPTVFLPYPYHRDQHQRHNAQPLVSLDAAVMVDDAIDAQANLQTLGPILRDLLGNADRRSALREALEAHRPPDAALRVAKMILASARGST
jgi:UDP-N-acetylglucosamine--N-acetylmuramyl-(pentapeptide) pyrophosphoryl-undecaprenol N-acetylglucosamine transferase